MYKYDNTFNKISVNFPRPLFKEDFSFPSSDKIKKMETWKIILLILVIISVLSLIVYYIRRYMENKENKKMETMSFKYY